MRNLILTCCVLWFGLTISANAEKRVALVIGNSAYERISPLANPRNDAELMASALEGVGFEVVSAIDVDRRAMGRAVRNFGKRLRRAGKDAVGLFYFAGHGIQSGGTNYLIPIGAYVEDEADLDLEAISASDVLRQMETAGNALNLVVLDACRNNPMASSVRSSSRGLARISAATGSLIAFAAAPGQVAADGGGRNSPYTQALVRVLKEPGLAVEQVFKRVRVSVEAETGGAQTPWEESSLRGDFYFVPKVVRPAVDEEALAWELVKGARATSPVQAFLSRYPSGRFSGEANTLLARLVADVERRRAERLKRETELRRQLEEARRAQGRLEQGRKEQDVAVASTSQAVASLTPSKPLSSVPSPQTVEEMLALGERYETGNGVAKDPSLAVRWYREAATMGSAEAKYRLGLAYYHGSGVGRSPTEAAILILGAVKLGHDPAIAALNTTRTLRDRSFLRAMQQRLKTLGHYRSAIDGKWGRKTRSAIIFHSGRKLPIKTDVPSSNRKEKNPKKIRPTKGKTNEKLINRHCRKRQNIINPNCNTLL